MATINQLHGLEILDSRGRPTVKAWCTIEGGGVGVASVPSGASSGAAEAHELRDGDATRYKGLGCLKAVQHINHDIASGLVGLDIGGQEELDQLLLELDGTTNKSRLGANAILAVSIAYARAIANTQNRPLYTYFSELTGSALRLPRLTINLFSGGLHAGGQVPVQDVLLVPASATTISEGLEHTYAVYQAAFELTKERYAYRFLRADEGGLAPPFEDAETMLSIAVEAIEKTGMRPGEDISLAVDVAASHFYRQGVYQLGETALDGEAMVDRIEQWVNQYPIISVEDGLAEEDWGHWTQLVQRVGHKTRVVGDDLLCTNPDRISKAIDLNAANTLLLKVNQIGTLTEAAIALKAARNAGWQVTISARSGETEDNWLSDLAVGWAGNQIKIGSITQSERLSKYNRLLEIAHHETLPLEVWPGIE